MGTLRIAIFSFCLLFFDEASALPGWQTGAVHYIGLNMQPVVPTTEKTIWLAGCGIEGEPESAAIIKLFGNAKKISQQASKYDSTSIRLVVRYFDTIVYVDKNLNIKKIDGSGVNFYFMKRGERLWVDFINKYDDCIPG